MLFKVIYFIHLHYKIEINLPIFKMNEHLTKSTN